MAQKITAAASVNIGKRRGNNEDNLYFNGVFLTEENRETAAEFEEAGRDDPRFYAVCDGMGGEEMGELASLLTAETLHEKIDEFEKNTDRWLERVVSSANEKVCDAQRKNGGKNIGTTFALVITDKGTAHVANIGDSRIYLFRKGELKQISQDHTPVGRMLRAGEITKEQAKTHPRRNSLSQYIGIEPAEMVIQPYKTKITMKNKDCFMLCSDGLTDMVDEDDISFILAEAESPADAVRQLSDAALANGGKDNVTVIVFKYERSFFSW